LRFRRLATRLASRVRQSLVFPFYLSAQKLELVLSSATEQHRQEALLGCGVALGAPLGHAIGSVADYIAAALIAGLGIYMLLIENDQQDRLLSLIRRGLFGALALGVSISLDELAIGFSAGLLRLPIFAMVIAIAAQAFVATQIGIRLGSRVGEGMREATEKLAGLALVALGTILLITQLTA
jgi:putative Mn2+ efflux pump MntP